MMPSRLRPLALAAALLASIMPARANMTATTADNPKQYIQLCSVTATISGQTVHLPCQILVDPTGATFGTAANPMAMKFGTGATLPAFAATPTINIGTMPSVVFAGTPAVSVPSIGTTADAPATSYTDSVSTLLQQMRLSNNYSAQALAGLSATATYQASDLTALATLDTDLKATQPRTIVGSSNTAYGIPPATASTGTALAAKTSGGNLYGAYATNLSAANVGFLVVINATAAPSSGATIAPLACVPYSAAGASINYGTGPPAAFSTGIVVLITTAANCTTYTPGSASAFISASVR